MLEVELTTRTPNPHRIFTTAIALLATFVAIRQITGRKAALCMPTMSDRMTSNDSFAALNPIKAEQMMIEPCVPMGAVMPLISAAMWLSVLLLWQCGLCDVAGSPDCCRPLYDWQQHHSTHAAEVISMVFGMVRRLLQAARIDLGVSAQVTTVASWGSCLMVIGMFLAMYWSMKFGMQVGMLLSQGKTGMMVCMTVIMVVGMVVGMEVGMRFGMCLDDCLEDRRAGGGCCTTYWAGLAGRMAARALPQAPHNAAKLRAEPDNAKDSRGTDVGSQGRRERRLVGDDMLSA